MGASGSIRKRRRRAETSALLNKIADNANAKSGQIAALGVVVNSETPNDDLFVEDRKKPSREQLQEEERAKLAAERRQRRRLPKPRKSEHGVSGCTTIKPLPVSCPGKKLRKDISHVDKGIIAKRHNIMAESKNSGAKKVNDAASSQCDLWASELARKVDGSKSKVRRNIEAKLNKSVRKTTHVLLPGDGTSINPLHEAHQDALGEAVADEISRHDEQQWTEDALAVDPTVLQSADMQVADDQSDEEDLVAKKPRRLAPSRMPERKTRRDRNRASRRRACEARRLQKLSHRRISREIDRIEEVDAAAKAAVRKLEGKTAAARKKRKNKARARDGIAASAAMPLHRSLAGIRVPSEKDEKLVALSDDLAEQMRSVAMPSVNPLVRERFLAVQRRGLIEPPRAITTELVQARRERLREEMRDKLIRKGRGSRSNLTYWRKPRKR